MQKIQILKFSEHLLYEIWEYAFNYNPRKMSWNIQASLGENGSPLPHAMSRCANVFRIYPKCCNIEQWEVREGKSVSWSSSFLLIPNIETFDPH